jgi:hypothetical protein
VVTLLRESGRPDTVKSGSLSGFGRSGRGAEDNEIILNRSRRLGSDFSGGFGLRSDKLEDLTAMETDVLLAGRDFEPHDGVRIVVATLAAHDTRFEGGEGEDGLLDGTKGTFSRARVETTDTQLFKGIFFSLNHGGGTIIDTLGERKGAKLAKT